MKNSSFVIDYLKFQPIFHRKHYTELLLINFFENWKGRIPIKFYHYVYDSNYFTKEHVKILKKYFNEGIIEKTNVNLTT